MTNTQEKQLRMLGVSYRNAPVEVRESFARLATEARENMLGQQPEGSELVVLSTCNRAEIYTWAGAGSRGDCLDQLHRQFQPIADKRQPGNISSGTPYRLEGTGAARHLFRVACGLDSAVLGDVQILSQIKQARLAAKKTQSQGTVLDRLFQIAVRAGKQARHETEIGYGSASVGSALVSMLRSRSKSGSFRILLIGAGDAARNIGVHLAKSKLGSIVCINRTAGNARDLARRLEGTSRPWEELEPQLLESDLIVAATSADRPVLQRELLDELARRRTGESILIVDAGLPRNVEPGSAMNVIGIDQVRERQEAVIARRRASVPEVERIIEDALEEWAHWLASRPMEAILQSLFQELPGYAKQTAALLVDDGALTPEQTEDILTKSVQRLLHQHARRLRDCQFWAAQ